MHSYVQPSTELNNDLVILHCCTNDLRSEKQPLESDMKSNNNEVMVSDLIPRRDKLHGKGKEVNKLLQYLCISKKAFLYR